MIRRRSQDLYQTGGFGWWSDGEHDARRHRCERGVLVGPQRGRE
jgi:hypothetical protein